MNNCDWFPMEQNTVNIHFFLTVKNKWPASEFKKMSSDCSILPKHSDLNV